MSLRIRTLKLSGIRQFRDVTFDFSDPATGEPLDRICLIGGNGTGKSTILRLLASAHLLDIPGATPAWMEDISAPGSWAVEFSEGGESLNDSIAVYCPPDSELPPNSSSVTDVPSSNLDTALQFLNQPVSKFKVGQDSIAEFWKLLIALVKNREARLLEYHRLQQNQDRTIREVEVEFLARNPDILRELADLWEPILTKAGLMFDYEKASIPVQLTENLRAYIRLLADDAVVPYSELSTGIRSFLFRLGHLFTIFRFHPNKGGIVLIDEPENSLHPDFLFELLTHYERAAPGAQLFFATHSPIVAAQFKPEERFILEFDSDRGVVVRRGVTPEGDDPNDVLLKDFAVRTLYGPKGLESWKRFRELDQSIQDETDLKRRKEMLREYLELGRIYNFGPHDEVFA